jgi:Carboxypeptidase regulatory-like domain
MSNLRTFRVPELFMQGSSQLRRGIERILFVSFFSLVLQFNAIAQSAGTAAIQGTVRDSTGAAVMNASITFTNTETGTKRETQSDSVGNIFQ